MQTFLSDVRSEAEETSDRLIVTITPTQGTQWTRKDNNRASVRQSLRPADIFWLPDIV